MDQPGSINVVVPARNSFPDIRATLSALRIELANLDYRIYVVVNTSFPGQCARDARQYKLAIDASVTVVELPDAGKDMAVRWALMNVTEGHLGYVDADFGWEAESGVLSDFIAELTRGADLVYGVRSQIDWSLARKWKTNVFLRIVGLLLRLDIADTQAPMKFLSPRFSAIARDLLDIRGWGFDVELMWLAKRAGATLVAVPVTLKGKGGERSWVSLGLIVLMGIPMFMNLIRFWLWTIFRGRSIANRAKVRIGAAPAT